MCEVGPGGAEGCDGEGPRCAGSEAGVQGSDWGVVSVGGAGGVVALCSATVRGPKGTPVRISGVEGASTHSRTDNLRSLKCLLIVIAIRDAFTTQHETRTRAQSVDA